MDHERPTGYMYRRMSFEGEREMTERAKLENVRVQAAEREREGETFELNQRKGEKRKVHLSLCCSFATLLALLFN